MKEAAERFGTLSFSSLCYSNGRLNFQVIKGLRKRKKEEEGFKKIEKIHPF